jgi:glycosyltransferase involved in cell wall biosynthesis
VNITFVSDAIYPYNKGGKEKRLYELSTRLSKLGHDVHIYTMHWWDTPEKSRIENGVTLHAISKLYPMYNGERRSIKEGIIFGLACLRLLRVNFEILDVDHMPFFPIYSSWIVCTLKRKRLYGTWHEALSRRDWIDYMGAPGNIAAIIERISIHLPHRIIAASGHTQELIQKHLRRGNRVSLVTSGIDTKMIKKLQPADIDCHVLYVGRLVKDKNIDMLVRAMAIVKKTDVSIKCVIIGHGTEKKRIGSLIKHLGLEKQISLLEPLPHAKDIYSYMKASKVFCLPSVREGFGIVALEALGCGTPVITVDFDANAAKSLITEEVNGSVVPLRPSALAKAIEYWVGIEKPRDIANQVAGYDWNKLAKKLVEAYTL